MQCSTWRQVLAQDALARRRQGGVCTTSLPGTRHVGIIVHLEARQTKSRLLPTLSLTCTAFQETRHMLSGQPQLEYHGAGTRYAVPDLPYKCHLCHKKFRDMGGMMQHQVWKKKHGLKQVVTWVNPCKFSGLCPPCCEPKIGSSLKEESSRPKQ